MGLFTADAISNRTAVRGHPGFQLWLLHNGRFLCVAGSPIPTALEKFAFGSKYHGIAFQVGWSLEGCGKLTHLRIRTHRLCAKLFK